MTRSLKSIVLAASVAAFAGGFATGAQALDRLDVEKSIAAAKEAQKQADMVGGEWRDTDKMIKRAEQLLAEGKLEQADKMAREAEIQGMLGYMQATSQTRDNLHI